MTEHDEIRPWTMTHRLRKLSPWTSTAVQLHPHRRHIRKIEAAASNN